MILTDEQRVALGRMTDYILETEAQDFYDSALEYFPSDDAFRSNWRDMPHVYTAALILLGEEPDFEALAGEWT